MVPWNNVGEQSNPNTKCTLVHVGPTMGGALTAREGRRRGVTVREEEEEEGEREEAREVVVGGGGRRQGRRQGRGGERR